MSNRLRQNRIDTVPAAFINQVQKLLPELYQYLLSISSIQLSGGQVVRSQANMNAVLTLVDQFERWMLDPQQSGYYRAVQGFMGEFTQQKAINDAIITSFGRSPSAAETVYVAAKRRTAELLVGDGFKTNFIDRIRDTFIDSVSSKRSFGEVTTRLFEVINGDSKRDGQLLNWTKQVAHDRFAMTDRAYVEAAFEGHEWWIYQGGLIEDSREFCVERNNKIYHVSEIRDWANLDDWAGRMPGTDESTIFDNLGGYRCNHILVPVAEGDVPDDVKSRVNV